MTKYTKEDADVLILDTPDRVNFEFDMVRYNVDKNAEVSQGAQSISILRDPVKLANSFKNPRQLPVLILTILCFILIITLIVLAIFYMWYKFVNNNEEITEQIFKAIAYSVGIFLLLIFFYYMYNKINLDVGSLIGLVKQSERKIILV
jgi:hypothetical protein